MTRALASRPWSLAWRDAPLFEAVRPTAYRLDLPQDDFPEVAWLAQACARWRPRPESGSGRPLVPVSQVLPGRAYERHIYGTGQLPTRGRNWHDFFNLLVWLSFPVTKSALNRCHVAAQARRAADTARTPQEQALTQFDETGVVVACGVPELAELLREHAWKTLFWQRRREVEAAFKPFLFGHGLLEKALAPFAAMTGKAIVIDVPAEFFEPPLASQIARLDAPLAEAVMRLRGPSTLAPVPVLGFPGMTPENEAEAYYEDARVFRPRRGRE